MITSSWESPVTTWTSHNHPVQLQVSFDGFRLVFHGSMSVFIGFQTGRLLTTMKQKEHRPLRNWDLVHWRRWLVLMAADGLPPERNAELIWPHCPAATRGYFWLGVNLKTSNLLMGPKDQWIEMKSQECSIQDRLEMNLNLKWIEKCLQSFFETTAIHILTLLWWRLESSTYP